MTPEERFRNLEDLLDTLARQHVLFHSELQDLKHASDKHEAAIKDLVAAERRLIEHQDRLAQIVLNLAERQEENYREQQARDREHQERVEREMEALRELHRVGEEKLHALLATVDEIIRKRKD
jgi:hypothetical protein